MKKLKADLAGPEPLELEKLLAAGEGEFLLTSATRSAAVDRYYAHAWGLAYYLAFEKRLLTARAENYLQAGNWLSVCSAQRFQELIGVPLDQFQRQWRDYIRGL